MVISFSEDFCRCGRSRGWVYHSSAISIRTIRVQQGMFLLALRLPAFLQTPSKESLSQTKEAGRESCGTLHLYLVLLPSTLLSAQTVQAKATRVPMGCGTAPNKMNWALMFHMSTESMAFVQSECSRLPHAVPTFSACISFCYFSCFIQFAGTSIGHFISFRIPNYLEGR